jgi:iron complex outermembrane receptor protein
MEDLLLRASYSEGFRAPSLSELLSETSFSATEAVDYVACRNADIAPADCKPRQFDNLQESNPNLGPETSTYINAGIVYSGIENLSIKLDYFDLEVENVISEITVQSLINADYGGILDQVMNAYPGVSLVRDADGGIIGDVITRSENGAVLTRKGFDFDIEYKIETDFGEFGLQNVTTYLTESGEDVYFGGPVQDFSGFAGYPDWRSQFVLNYTIGDFAVTWTTDIIASTAEDDYLDIADGNPQNFRYKAENHNPTYVVHNINAKYFSEFGTFTVGARNLFDKGIVRDDNGLWVDDTLYQQGHIGRELFAGYRISF